MPKPSVEEVAREIDGVMMAAAMADGIDLTRHLACWAIAFAERRVREELEEARIFMRSRYNSNAKCERERGHNSGLEEAVGILNRRLASASDGREEEKG